MKNLFQYLKIYGNCSFEEVPFNDIDSLILTELVYAKLKNIAPYKRFSSKKLKDICSLFLVQYSKEDFKKEDYLFPNSYRLIVLLEHCTRFMDAKISHYIEEATSETQFGAMTVRFSNGICFVAFEGTDSSIAGWKEDFQLMYLNPTLSQERGRKYFNETIHFWDRKIYVGGHSKGGNIAMYAYMYAKPSIKKRVLTVYNFDGPGFLKTIMNSKLYTEMAKKLKMYVPEQSYFGMMLGHTHYNVVKSNGFGILQHDGFTWNCKDTSFERGTLSKKSKNLEKNLEKYLETMSDDDKKLFVETLSLVCEHLHIYNVMQFRDIHLPSIMHFLKEIRTIPDDMKKRFLDVIKLLLFG